MTSKYLLARVVTPPFLGKLKHITEHTSLFAFSRASSFSASRRSSRSLTARAASFTTSLPLDASMLFWQASQAVR
eukprot:scaffold218374_cov14-Tisochrysis_lutea.AAC.1